MDGGRKDGDKRKEMGGVGEEGERGGGSEKEGRREREREGGREGEGERERTQLTSLIINSLHDRGRNFPLDAGNTPMSCSRGAKGIVPRSKSLRTLVTFLKSEANGA